MLSVFFVLRNRLCILFMHHNQLNKRNRAVCLIFTVSSLLTLKLIRLPFNFIYFNVVALFESIPSALTELISHFNISFLYGEYTTFSNH